MLPKEFNQISDELLFALVDGAAVSDEIDGFHPALAPYLTLEVLQRVRARVWELKQRGSTTRTKHEALARAVLLMTGLDIPPDKRDVDKIGNNLDCWLTRRYVQEMRKLTNNIRDVAVRERHREELGLQCCVVTGWGWVQEHQPPMPSEAPAPAEPVQGRAPYVPYTQSCATTEVSPLELKASVNEARRQAESFAAELSRERERAQAAKRCYESAKLEVGAAKSLLKASKKAKLEAEQQAAQKLRKELERQRTECARLQRNSTKALRDAEAKVLRLSGQAAARAQEAAVHAEREERARRSLQSEQDRADAEAERMQGELAALHAENEAARHAAEKERRRADEAEDGCARVEQLRQESELLRAKCKRVERESKQSIADAQAKVFRLGSQSAARAQEAAEHAQREQKAQELLQSEQERAQEEVGELRKQLATMRSDHKRALDTSKQALQEAEGKVLRLGGLAAERAQEAAVHAQREEEARRREEEKAAALQEALAQEEYHRLRAQAEEQIRRERAKECSIALAARDAVKETSQKRACSRRRICRR